MRSRQLRWATRPDPLQYWQSADLAAGYSVWARPRLTAVLRTCGMSAIHHAPSALHEPASAIARALGLPLNPLDKDVAMTALLLAALDGDPAARLVFAHLQTQLGKGTSKEGVNG